MIKSTFELVYQYENDIKDDFVIFLYLYVSVCVCIIYFNIV